MLQIDLHNVFAEKNPRLAKRMPRFVLRIIEKILHLEEINKHLRDHEDKRGVENVRALLSDLRVTYKMYGIENLDQGHRYQFASNHPLGALDGIILLEAISQHVGEPRFLVNDLLLKLQVFDPLFVPINAFGSTSKDAAKLIEKAYSSDMPVIIFPSGMASRKIKGKITDLEWKKSFVQKTIEHQRDIVPVFFNGRNSKRFYRIANWRKRLGIKSNIEMFFLPSELYKQRGRHFEIFIGKPIPWQEIKNTKSIRQWTEEIRRIVYSLEK
jgi:putative hemolysin